MNENINIEELCDTIRQTAYSIHCYLGTGFLEKVYENALVHRLKKQGILVESQVPLDVYDEDGTNIGEFFADIIVENKIIIELKSCENIKKIHVAQLMNYLKATSLKHGLLINFGSETFQIKKYIF
jgi:GxxExxY protein